LFLYFFNYSVYRKNLLFAYLLPPLFLKLIESINQLWFSPTKIRKHFKTLTNLFFLFFLARRFQMKIDLFFLLAKNSSSHFLIYNKRIDALILDTNMGNKTATLAAISLINQTNNKLLESFYYIKLLINVLGYSKIFLLFFIIIWSSFWLKWLFDKRRSIDPSYSSFKDKVDI